MRSAISKPSTRDSRPKGWRRGSLPQLRRLLAPGLGSRSKAVSGVQAARLGPRTAGYVRAVRLQPKTAFPRFPPVHKPELEGQQRVDSVEEPLQPNEGKERCDDDQYWAR